jgi:hypothetical protein
MTHRSVSEHPTSGERWNRMSDEGAALFEDDDAGYLQWSRRHPDGFVINALRGSFDDPILHRAECWSITRHIGDHKNWTRQ